MNSAYRKYISKVIGISFIVYVGPFLVLTYVLLSGLATGTDSSFIEFFKQSFSYTDYAMFVTPLAGLAVLYLYYYMYNEEYNTMFAQFPITNFHRFIIPIIALILPGIVIDIFLPFGNGNESFFAVYAKYFVVAFGVLFTSTSRNRKQILLIVGLAVIAITSSNNQIIGNIMRTLAFTPFNFFVVILGTTIPIFLAYKIYSRNLRTHDYEKLAVIYYIELLLIGTIFFIKYFINKYPFKTDLVGIDIGNYSLSILFYIIVFIAIIIFIVYRTHKFDFKKILALYLPIILVSLFYIVTDSIVTKSRLECKYYNTRKYNKDTDDFMVLDSYSSIDVLGSKNEVNDYLTKNAKMCFRTSNSGYDTADYLDSKEVQKRKEQIISYRGVSYVLKENKNLATDSLDVIKKPKNISYISLIENDIEYRVVYIPKGFTKEQVKLIKEKLNKTPIVLNKFQTMYIDDQEGKDILNKTLLNTEDYLDDKLSSYSTYLEINSILSTERVDLDTLQQFKVSDENQQHLKEYVFREVK